MVSLVWWIWNICVLEFCVVSVVWSNWVHGSFYGLQLVDWSRFYFFCYSVTNECIHIVRIRITRTPAFLISNFHCVLNVVCFLLGNSPVSEFYMPLFQNTVCPIFIVAYEDGTDSVPKQWHIKFRHWGITQKRTYNKLLHVLGLTGPLPGSAWLYKTIVQPFYHSHYVELS
jgi:hypothetical protein